MTANLPLIEDLGQLNGAHVLVRLDLNVPMATMPSGERTVSDDFRIRACVPTLTWLQMQGAHVTACTHLGRPEGRPDPRFDVSPVRRILDEMVPGIRLLENLRFSPGETSNEPEFVKSLIEGQDCYVNDAFGVCHRAHASVVGPPRFLPSAAGRLVGQEVEQLGGLLDAPARPFVVAIGGAKVSDKLGLLRNLAARADRLLIGGAMAFTFTSALGEPAGDSLVETDRLEECGALLREFDNISLPIDAVAAAPAVSLATTAPAINGDLLGIGAEDPNELRVVGRAIPAGWRGLDIGPATADMFGRAVRQAATVLWNGPMGVFEDPRFAAGTKELAEAVAASAGHTVIGGGDSVAAIHRYGLAERIDHISTGGGASLAFLEHGDLPGLAALRHAPAADRVVNRR
jgi:phosphoglycerate kinase